MNLVWGGVRWPDQKFPFWLVRLRVFSWWVSGAPHELIAIALARSFCSLRESVVDELIAIALAWSVSSLRESVVDEFIAIALAMPQHAHHVRTAVPSGHAGAKERRPGSHHSIGNSTSNAIPNGLTMHSPERLGEI